MLSYRHGFHAGHHADVLKHAVLLFLLRYLQRKEAPLLILDSHAGAGRYDLGAPEALKLGEFRGGIAKLLARGGTVPDALADYLALVRAANPGGGLAVYPGSPALEAALLRPQDRLALFELHPGDRRALAALMRGRPRVTVSDADGLKGLVASLPPPERRGLFVIDPSYEVKSDYVRVPAALLKACRRFATGVYLLWYPVIERARVDAMIAALLDGGPDRLYRLELCVAPDKAGPNTPKLGMTGSGLLIVNPPYTLPLAAATFLPWLADALNAKGPLAAEWLAGG